MTRLFGFAQLDFAGALAVADGRYVVREDGEERVLVLETLGAPGPPRRRRRRARELQDDTEPAALPLTRATAVRAFAPFVSAQEASLWLEEAIASENAVDLLVAEGLDQLNRALHAHAAASGDLPAPTLTPRLAVAVRLGFGSGEEVANGDFTSARDVDVRGGASPRRQRVEELRPQERLAAVLGGRERLDACETLLPRARADLDAGREREAALQLRVGLEALLLELRGALADPGHEDDMAVLDSRRQEAGELANAALSGELEAKQAERLGELLDICERVLRRRRVLRG